MPRPSRTPREVSDLQIGKRNNIIKNINRINDLIKANGESFSIEELDCRLEIVETYFQEALEAQVAIEETGNAAERINAIDLRGEMEDLYCSVKVHIRELIKEKVADNNKVNVHKNNTSSKLSDNLPKIKLPTFTGIYGEFPNFIRLFKKLVHEDTRISKIEKFNHLISCLSGSALRAVKALDFIEANYDAALSLLEARFDNKYLTCKEHIKCLLSLSKVHKGSAEQLRELIDQVTTHSNALCSLSSYEELYNSIIVHLMMLSLDNDSQFKLEEAIDSSKPVSLTECLQIVSQRCQILETHDFKPAAADQVQSRSKNNNRQFGKTKPVALSVSTNNCGCCNQNTTHPLWKCHKFLELSPVQRFEQAKRLSVCINCLSSQHTVRNCKSSSCKQCKSMHHTLLHRNIGTNN